ncbi:hypothetical protein V7056_20550 [Bacillus sp. JJ664]
MNKWENVAQGIAIVIVLTLISFYFEKIGISFWFKYMSIIIMIPLIIYLVSKIKVLQKPVSKKRGWITFTTVSIFIIFLSDFVLK